VQKRIELREAAAWLVLGRVTASQLKAAADSCVDAGRITPSLAELATLTSDSLSEAEPLFHGALAELGLTLPDKDEAVWDLLRVYVAALADGSLDPERGLALIRGVHETANLHERDKVYVGDSYDLQELIGCYWQFDDIAVHRTEVGWADRYQNAVQQLQRATVSSAEAWLAKHAG